MLAGECVQNMHKTPFIRNEENSGAVGEPVYQMIFIFRSHPRELFS